jgi:hypothetical protein
MSNLLPSTVTTYQFLAEGGDPDHDCWALYGGQCVAAPVFEFKNGEVPRVKFTIEFPKWDCKDNLVASSALVTFTNTTEVLVKDSFFRAWTINTATPATPVALQTPLNTSDITFDFGAFKYLPITSPSGVGNVGAYVVSGESPKAKGTFKLPYDTDVTAWRDAWTAKTLFEISFQVGSSPTYGCILLSIGCCQVTDWQLVRSSGIVEQVITWVARRDLMHYTGTSTDTTIAKSPMRLHIF